MTKLKNSFFALLIVALFATYPVISGDTPPEDAGKKSDTCSTDAAAYPHGAIANFHNMLCTINVRFPGMAEEFLFKLVTKIGMDPDVSKLAADGTPTVIESKTFGGKVITGTMNKVVAPSTFAGTYDTMAAVSVDGTVFTTMYWTGSGSTSKGFLIMGGLGLGTQKHVLYVKWDRTSAAQSVAVIGTRMASTYLASPTTDDAIYGKVTYDTGTKATTVQVVNIGSQRGASPSTSTFACWKMYATGTSGGAMRVGKTQDSFSTSGHADNSTAQDGIVEMDDWEGDDLKTTANGTGNGTPVQGFAMDYSCNDLKTAGATGRPFEGNVPDMGTTKSEMDAMFSAM